MHDKLSRRTFLGWSAVGAAGLLLPNITRATTVVFGSGRRPAPIHGLVICGSRQGSHGATTIEEYLRMVPELRDFAERIPVGGFAMRGDQLWER